MKCSRKKIKNRKQKVYVRGVTRPDPGSQHDIGDLVARTCHQTGNRIVGRVTDVRVKNVYWMIGRRQIKVKPLPGEHDRNTKKARWHNPAKWTKVSALELLARQI